MRPVVALLPLLALAACATPRESCIAQVSQDLNVVNQLIAQTTLNLQRGYGVDTRQEVRNIPRMCSDHNSDGTIDWDICNTTYVRDVDVPVALDLREEQAKLEQLQAQQRRLSAPTDAAVAQCAATYPE